MDEQTTTSNRNAPHIQRVETIQKQIISVAALADDKKFDKASEAVDLIRKDVQSSYNNREMSLVATKLQEASFSLKREDKKQSITKLEEAHDWAGQYIKVLL
jgi:hypothetical protein